VARNSFTNFIAVFGFHDFLDGLADHLQRNKILVGFFIAEVKNQLTAAPADPDGRGVKLALGPVSPVVSEAFLPAGRGAA
jgi:hypothetical protein